MQVQSDFVIPLSLSGFKLTVAVSLSCSNVKRRSTPFPSSRCMHIVGGRNLMQAMRAINCKRIPK